MRPLTALVLLLAFTGSLIFASQLNYRYRIPWSHYEVLDIEWLQDNPVRSVFCLHSQPPLHNGLLSAAVQISNLLGCAPEVVFRVFYWLIGFLGLLALWYLMAQLSAPMVMRWGVTACYLISPGQLWFAHYLTYTYLTHNLLLIGVALLHFALESGRVTSWILPYLSLLGVVLTRTLFPPVFGALVLGLVIVSLVLKLPCYSGSKIWRPGLMAFLLGAALFSWPIKNYLVYGEFVNSSWRGYNLQRNTDAQESSQLSAYLTLGKVQESEKKKWRTKTELCGKLPQNTRAAKSTGKPNWHHAVFLSTYSEMAKTGLQWKLENPGKWFKTALALYFFYTRPSDFHPYLNRPWGAKGTERLSQVFHSLFFFDLRAEVETLIPLPSFHSQTRVRSKPVPYTVFGLFLFPGVVLLGLYFLSRENESSAHALKITLSAALFCIAWNCLVPLLTDGIEGNRMRFCTSGLFVFLGVYVGGNLLKCLPAVGNRTSSPASRGQNPADVESTDVRPWNSP